jgi:glycosyltransferase involved in cell wall biosynthesis
MTPTLVEGDGVGNDVLGMARALEKVGHRVQLFAQVAAVPAAVRPVEQIGRALRSDDDVFIYHHSIHSEHGIKALKDLPGKKIAKYHNVTPPKFFEKTDSDVAKGCTAGLRQVGDLVAAGCHLWVDSPFNGEDIRRHRDDAAFEELPPFNQVDLLTKATPDTRGVAAYDDWRTNILMVGRLVPNKNVVLALEAFADYRARYDRRARLVIVGDLVLSKYSQRVSTTIARLDLGRDVVITGKVSAEQLKAFYLASQVLLVTSEHEGFCLPLIEAMSLRTPVVAVRNAAIPFTAGPAAEYAETDTPAAVADALARVLGDEARREGLCNLGHSRYHERFTNELVERRFLELFERAVEG